MGFGLQYVEASDLADSVRIIPILADALFSPGNATARVRVLAALGVEKG